MSDTYIDVPTPPGTSTLGISPLILSTYPKVHGLVGAQFGDLEYDVGKSTRWLDFYTDDLFITDINTGQQRYWVINWDASFPGSGHTVTGRNFFYDTTQAALWRQEQFQWGDKTFHYNDNDWCLFMDGHEGLSMDNRTLPTDYNTAPFMSWIYREIERVGAGDTVVLPFFVYLKYSDLQNIIYGSPANQAASALGLPVASQAVSVPWYLPSQGLPRLFKVSALRNVSFDWSSLDRLATPTANCKLQIISYAYAHWQMLDIPPGQTTVPPLDATNDLGWKMRQLISRIRPITGIPFSDPWKDPTTDPTSFPGPWCVDTTGNLDSSIATTVEEDGHTAPNATCDGIRVPLYDTVLRLNLRDGLWYERDMSGNIPLVWDDVNQVWVPRYDPDQWSQLGVGSDTEPTPAANPTSLRLDGTAGTFTRTGDSNDFDFVNAFTLAVIVQLVDMTPSARQTLVSKWGAAGQRSWYWAIESNGDLSLVISRDGTAGVTFMLPHADVGVADNEAVALGVNFVTTTFPSDEVRFWRWDGTAWVQIGATQAQPNPTVARVFNSTAEVQVGATLGLDNANGLFRVVSLRSGIGSDPSVFYSGGEVARMRGDTTLDPSYDRYGNLWDNQGSGWSYAPMTDPPSPTNMVES